MATYLNDQEQVDLLKKLWKRYGNLVLITIAVIALIVAGWRFFSSRHKAEIARASSAYQMVLNSVMVKNPDPAKIQALAKHVMKQYSSTGYAALSALLLSAQNVKAGKLNQAKTNLQWALHHTDNIQYKAIITLRLARLEIALSHAKQALALLANAPKGFKTSYDVVTGEAYAAMKQYSQAKTSYNKALALLPQADPYREMVLTYLSGLPAS